ncbi:host attachment protein [Brevundimonas sp.]|uniref:baeRF12 domain-containing protein n=1 Tax=Brevundimonas sp. TaxID=1871086 RepID=UPI002737B92E|nr:host attachment protein [Brevundimonas sp.]MDP3802319.1 host attachment protein [Brevundimonas sp.]
MDIAGPGLIVVADGRQARLFEERRRGGPLIDITARLGDLSLHGPEASGSRGGAHDRLGPASHTGDGATPQDRREADFIGLVGVRAAEIMRRGGYQDLAMIAAPRALGQLRRVMAQAGVEVAHSESHDRVSESPASLRTRLRELRRGS